MEEANGSKQAPEIPLSDQQLGQLQTLVEVVLNEAVGILCKDIFEEENMPVKALLLLDFKPEGKEALAICASLPPNMSAALSLLQTVEERLRVMAGGELG